MLRKLLLEVSVPAPTTADNRTWAMWDPRLTQANFDTKYMVIILAAFLCALICSLGLSSMLHCIFLRCGQRLGMETSQQSAARIALRKMPVAVYGADDCKESDTGTDPSGTECTICLGEFIDGEKVRLLPNCNHRFHVSCIDTWLGSHSSCPNCRGSLLEAGSSSKVASADRVSDQPTTRGGGEGGDSRQEHAVVEVSGGS